MLKAIARRSHIELEAAGAELLVREGKRRQQSGFPDLIQRKPRKIM